VISALVLLILKTDKVGWIGWLVDCDAATWWIWPNHLCIYRPTVIV